LNIKQYSLIALLATCLAYGVVILGAYVRLSNAGLGCPDWPVCYGRIVPPTAEPEVAAANAAYPQRPVETAKAWKEQVHRYFASTLGMLIVILAMLAYRQRRQPHQPLVLPSILVLLVVLQGLLGMWTVTLLLKPLVVMLHLLGGMTTLLLLWLLHLRTRTSSPLINAEPGLHTWALLALTMVYLQIALGGWTSSNYAALACRDFPTCQGSFWPAMDFKEAFVLWHGLGINYEYGVLEAPARTAIHVMHRYGALLTAIVLGALGMKSRRAVDPRLRCTGNLLLCALLLQLTLGVSNVVFGLPLPVAVAHNAGAALLLLTTATVVYFTRRSAT
jgi:cytochrome c oxidase assembly protein subunit 15